MAVKYNNASNYSKTSLNKKYLDIYFNAYWLMILSMSDINQWF